MKVKETLIAFLYFARVGKIFLSTVNYRGYRL